MNKSDIWQLNHGQNHESKQFNARVPLTSTPIIGIYVPNQTLEHIYIQYQKYKKITRMHLQLINLYINLYILFSNSAGDFCSTSSLQQLRSRPLFSVKKTSLRGAAKPW